MDDRQLVQNIIASKMQVLDNSTFFGLLLQHLKFAIDTACPTACTDGERVYFGPNFCDGLSVDELTVVLLHELMHVVLGHCFRGRGYNHALYNIAADIVVNSTIQQTLGLDITVRGEELMHVAPDGKEGYLYTAEDVYEMLLNTLPKSNNKRARSGNRTQGDGEGADADMAQGNGEGADADMAQGDRQNGDEAKDKDGRHDGNATAADAFADDFEDDYDTSAYDHGRLDDHTKWGETTSATKAEWQGHVVDACRTTLEQGKAAGRGAQMAERLYKELTQPTINWRLLLNNFVQTEVADYSFMPPDKRYDDFFLPDFNDPVDTVKDLWIVVDTSGSVSNKDIARAYSEIRGGIEQFGGKLKAKVSFFDAKVSDPVEVESVEELLAMRPIGGGGTSFYAVFDYYRKHLHDKEEITGIIVLTDGYAVFPPASAALDTPVFWLINNALVTPPWGVVARYLDD